MLPTPSVLRPAVQDCIGLINGPTREAPFQVPDGSYGLEIGKGQASSEARGGKTACVKDDGRRNQCEASDHDGGFTRLG
jgi:hypothetical protein